MEPVEAAAEEVMVMVVEVMAAVMGAVVMVEEVHLQPPVVRVEEHEAASTVAAAVGPARVAVSVAAVAAWTTIAMTRAWEWAAETAVAASVAV